MSEVEIGNASVHCDARRQEMREPEEVVAMLRLHRLGWGSKRIAAQLGCSRNTVKRYLRMGGWRASRMPKRPHQLLGLEGWLAERFERHRGNADVIRQELVAEHGIAVFDSIAIAVRRGIIDVEGMITRHLPLERINEGLDDLRTGSGIRTVIDF